MRVGESGAEQMNGQSTGLKTTGETCYQMQEDEDGDAQEQVSMNSRKMSEQECRPQHRHRIGPLYALQCRPCSGRQEIMFVVNLTGVGGHMTVSGPGDPRLPTLLSLQDCENQNQGHVVGTLPPPTWGFSGLSVAK